MWWYATGWWWWWLLFLIVFFLLPLGYGWGYRGWGPWYRRRTPTTTNLGAEGTTPDTIDEGWGWGASFLWIILLIALVWFVAAVIWRPAV